MEITNERIPSRKLLILTLELSEAQLGQATGDSFQRLITAAEDLQLVISGWPYVGYQKVSLEGQIDTKPLVVEFGLPVEQLPISEGLPEGITSRQTEAIQAAVTEYAGDDSEMELVYRLMIDAIREENHQFLHKSYEYYLEDQQGQPLTRIEMPYL